MTDSVPNAPAGGERIQVRDGQLVVPDPPVLPFIEGDGTGPDIWAASQPVFDAAVEKAYGGRRRIHWMEVLAGEKSFQQTGSWLPDETLDAFREYLVGIKGPLTTPVGGGIRSLNVALRQILDLYACVRPVRWFEGVPQPREEAGRRGHGDLPREHGRHLRRHRVRGGDRRREALSRGVLGDVPRPLQEGSLPRVVAASGSSPCRARAPSGWFARRSSTRWRTAAAR